MFLRIDMPGHVKHKQGDTFSEIYLSYLGGPQGTRIPASEFLQDFSPDAKFNYRRDANPVPQRFHPRRSPARSADRQAGPWLAGMTLDPGVVYEAWCHQRGYVCMIEEFGGRPVQAGGSFSAAFMVGYFDSIEEMHQVYDKYKGTVGLEVDGKGYRLVRANAASGR